MSTIALDARIISSSTGRYIERLVHYLEQIDRENQYFILVRRKDLGFYRPTNPNFTVVEADFADYSFDEQIGFKKLLETLKPDLVHFCMPQQPIGYKGKSVTTLHDLNLVKTWNSDKNWLIYHAKQTVGRYVFKRIAKINDYIIVPTKFTQEEYIAFSGIPREKTILTYEAADVYPDKLEAYPHPFKQFLLYVGQQSDYKNIRRLGDAHQQLLERHPDLGLILVGKKTAAHLKNEAYFQSKGYKNILFTDFIPDSQRDWLFTRATAYVFPSLMEGFGLPALEAMGYGAPVASSNATCLPEVYGEAALYFDPLSVDDIAAVTERYLTNPELRAQQIELGYKQFKKYSWKRMAEQTLEVYKRALGAQ